MQTHAEATLNGYGPFSIPEQEPWVIARMVGDVAVIDLRGPLVMAWPVHILRYRIKQLLHEGIKNFALNLAEAPYADSSGVSLLAGTYNLIQQAGGRIKFFAASERLVRTLNRLRLDTIFELFENETAVLSSFH
jgi:anti-anti-sigma factor